MIRLAFSDRHNYMRWKSPVARPLLVVTLFGPAGDEVTTYGLVDSGADVSMFHASFGEAIGLDVPTGKVSKAEGISGATVMAFTHTIDLEIGTRRLSRVPVDFSYDIGDEYPDQLIGRQEVFDQLRFAFCHAVPAVYVGVNPKGTRLR